MVNEFPFKTFQSEKRDYLFMQNFRLSQEFSSGTNQENLYHLHPNRNFREFVVNDKQLMSTSDRILKIHFWELCRVISNDDTSYFARYAWTLFSKLNWSLLSSLKEHRLGKRISFPESALLCPAERATIGNKSVFTNSIKNPLKICSCNM